MSQHIVASFDADLKSLDDMVLTMGRSVIRQHQDASELVTSRDSGAAGRIINADRSIDNTLRDEVCLDRLSTTE